MKKLLLIAAVAVMGSSAYAQEFRFGPKAGFAMSTLKLMKIKILREKEIWIPNTLSTLEVWQNTRSMIISDFRLKFYILHLEQRKN
jgi:hypothetical protein